LQAGTDLTTFTKLSNLDLRPAPNPASTKVNISVEALDEKGGVLSAFDAQGRLAWQQKIPAQQTTVEWDFSKENIAQGMYFVTLRSEGKIAVKRLVVQQ